MKIARADFMLHCSLVLERMEFADGVGLEEKVDRVWNDVRLDYYVHSGSLLSMMMGVRRQLQRHAHHVSYSRDMMALLCIADAANLNLDGQFCHGMFYGGHSDDEAHGGNLFMVYLLGVDSSVVIDAMMEYLVLDEYAECRRRATELVVLSVEAWIDVLQYVFDTPSCLPGLIEISLDVPLRNPWTRAVPVRTPLLCLWVNPKTVSVACETVAKAVGLTHLWICTAGGVVCEFENETVHSVMISCGEFAGRFPNLRRLTCNCVGRVDLTGCPSIELVCVEQMGRGAYESILMTAPLLPTRPFFRGMNFSGMSVEARGYEKELAAIHASHLLPQIDATIAHETSAPQKLDIQYAWTPLVHRSFEASVRQTIGVFLLGLERLMDGRGLDDDARVAPQDPAMLEESLRRGVWRQRCDFM